MPVLLVTLLKATDLPAADYGLAGSKSDPYVTFQVSSEHLRSTAINDTLNPEWQPAERFEFDVYDAEREQLVIRVVDKDTFNSDDLIGSVTVPVSKYLEHANMTVAEKLALELSSDYIDQQLNSEIHLEVCLKTEDEGQKALYVWENEMWADGTWKPAHNNQRRHWSTYDEQVSSNNFDDVAPHIPDGLEGQGWAYSTKKGDDHGWTYAACFNGPWSAIKSSSACARRRLWQNNCRPAVASE